MITPKEIQARIDAGDCGTVNVKDLKKWKRNPRKGVTNAARALTQTLQTVGWGAPLLVQQSTNRIIGGHTRLEAAKMLGLERVPVVTVDCDDRTADAMALADNRMGEKASWEMAGLADIMEQFSLEEVEALGWDSADLEQMAADLDGMGPLDQNEVEEDEAPSDVEPRVKLGDLWQLGQHRLYCGDATEQESYVALGMTGFNLLLTDPPYNVAYEGKTKEKKTIENDSMSDQHFRRLLTESLGAAFRQMQPGASFYIWHADSEGYNFRGAVRDCDEQVRQCLIWVKQSMVLGRQDYHWQHEPCLYGWKGGASHSWYGDRKQTTLLNFDRPSSSQEHPTMKPVALFAYQIKNSSKAGDLVLDPFMGSGTTIMACEHMERVACGFELDPTYCDVILARWEAKTGQKAEKL